VYRDIGKMLHGARRGRLITSRISPQGLVAHVPVLKENKMSLTFPSWGPAAGTCYVTHTIPTPLHMHLSLTFPSWGPAACTCYVTHAIATPLHMHLFP